MSEHLSKEDWQSLMADIANGSAQISVPRGLSRHFFTHVTASSINSVTGSHHLPQKLLVLSLLSAAILTGLATLYQIMVAFEDLAFIAVPLVGIFWTVIAGFTTDMGPGLKVTLPAAAVLVVGAYFLAPPYNMTVMLLIASLSFYRISHLFAEVFVVALVKESFQAWEMMEMHVRIDKDAA